MHETERIAEALRQIAEGDDPWHGPSIASVVDGLTAEQAAARPVAGVHSIRELLHHVTAWHVIVRRRIAGEPIVPTNDMVWPAAADPDETAWRHAREVFRTKAGELREAIAAFDEARLDQPTHDAPGAGTWSEQLHGVLHHDAWHGGQMALLRRALGAPLAQ